MADDYCAAGDLYDFGFPRGAVPNPGRLADSALSASNLFALDAHGFDADDPVMVRAEAGGALPAPLVAGTTYYAAPLTDGTFALSATAGGATIDLTSDGTRVVVIAPLPIAPAIAYASRLVDDMLPAHVVPLTAPYPAIVVMTCAEIAAGKLAARAGSTSKALADIVDSARKRLERWGKGVPIRGTNAPVAASLAASAVVPYLDPTGWRRWGGL